MDKLQEFKTFIKTQPVVMEKIHSGELTWQKVYEIYDIHGQNHPLFQSEKKEETPSETKTTTPKNGSEYVNNALKMFQDIDMDKVTTNLQSIQKVMGIFGEITKGNSKDNQPLNDIKSRRYRRYND